MLGQRVGAIIVIVIGVVVAGLYFAFTHLLLLLAGVFVLGVGVSWLLEVRRREPIEADDRQAIRALWKLTRRIPEGRLVVDPVTRQPFGIHRNRDTVNLILPRYLADDDSTGSTDDVMITHYLVGSLGLPHPPPLLRHEELVRASDHGPTTPMPWREVRQLLAFNDETGALNVERDEVLALTAQLERALKTLPSA